MATTQTATAATVSARALYQAGAAAERVYAATWETAYAFTTYGAKNWLRLAEALLGAGYTEDQAAAIMLSKIARWSADCQGFGAGSASATAAGVFAFLADKRNARVLRTVLAEVAAA